jgi:hypothetical protein
MTGNAVRYPADAPIARNVRFPGPGVPVMTMTNTAKANSVARSMKRLQTI